MIKFIAIYYLVGLSARTLGRLSNPEYRKFSGLLIQSRMGEGSCSHAQLDLYDYEVTYKIVTFLILPRG